MKTFSAEALANFQTTSAVAPSSRYLIRAMLAPLPLARARAVVEFGLGTGAITRALLDSLPRPATLSSFAISPRPPRPRAGAPAGVGSGPGPGPTPRPLLAPLPRQATLYSFEISPRFRD